MSRTFSRNIAYLVLASAAIVCATCVADLLLFSSSSRVSPTDATFLEGLFFIILGVLLFLGSGGINRASREATLLAAAASAISGDQVIGPSEILRRDAWKPTGFMFVGLVLIVAGAALVAIYFAALYF